jgi:hypothetical protein
MRMLPILLLAAITCAAPAQAQIVGRPDYGAVGRADPFLGSGFAPGPGIGGEVRHIRERIGQARAAGLITRGEARRLDREARLIARLGHRYGRDGLSGSERGELERRAAVLRGRIGR